MKITFVNPKVTQNIMSRSLDIPEKMINLLDQNPGLRSKIEFSKKAMGAMGLLCVAAVVPSDIEVEFFDENMEEVDYDRNFDLVALGGNVGQMNRALTIIDALRKRNIPIVAGGPAVATFPDQYIKRNISIVIGEGELQFKEFISDFLAGKAKDVYTRSDSLSHPDLTDIPFPRYDLAAKYSYEMVGVQCSRGCPYDCAFCQVTRIYGKKFRLKTAQRVAEEVAVVRKYWPDSFLLFYDDNPFFNREFAFDVFERIYSQGIHLPRWGANANVTLYKDPELLKMITRQGPVSFLGIGLESLSEDTLGNINNTMKHNNVSKYKEAIETFKAHGINPVGYFMFGFEDSKKKDLDDIVNFALENKIDGALTRVTPMPGTILYERIKKKYEMEHGLIRKSSLGEWGVVRNYLNELNGIREEEIKNLLSDAYSELFCDKNFCHSDGPVPFYFLL